MVRALQKPLVATDASPPNTQAMAPFQAALPRTSRWWVMAWAHPAAGRYREPRHARVVGHPHPVKAEPAAGRILLGHRGEHVARADRRGIGDPVLDAHRERD